MKCVADAADDLEAAVIIDALEAEVLALARSQVARNDAKEALEIARANAIVGGQITGKNAEEREAAARMLTAVSISEQR